MMKKWIIGTVALILILGATRFSYLYVTEVRALPRFLRVTTRTSDGIAWFPKTISISTITNTMLTLERLLPSFVARAIQAEDEWVQGQNKLVIRELPTYRRLYACGDWPTVKVFMAHQDHVRLKGDFWEGTFMVNGGGSHFLQVEFNAETKTFTNFSMNAPM